jgi:hypothetical protein
MTHVTGRTERTVGIIVPSEISETISRTTKRARRRTLQKSTEHNTSRLNGVEIERGAPPRWRLVITRFLNLK